MQQIYVHQPGMIRVQINSDKPLTPEQIQMIQHQVMSNPGQQQIIIFEEDEKKLLKKTPKEIVPSCLVNGCMNEGNKFCQALIEGRSRGCGRKFCNDHLSKEFFCTGVKGYSRQRTTHIPDATVCVQCASEVRKDSCKFCLKRSICFIVIAIVIIVSAYVYGTF